MVRIRTAGLGDHDRLRDLDLATFSTTVSPGTPPGPDTDMFERRPAEDYLVGEVDDDVVGYIMVGHPTPLPASAHVLQIQGLAVDPAATGHGVGTALVQAAVAEARRRGAVKIGLRVLGSNTRARRVYERAGFVVEGVLRDEFMLEGQTVDDIFMALPLTPAP